MEKERAKGFLKDHAGCGSTPLPESDEEEDEDECDELNEPILEERSSSIGYTDCSTSTDTSASLESGRLPASLAGFSEQDRNDLAFGTESGDEEEEPLPTPDCRGGKDKKTPAKKKPYLSPIAKPSTSANGTKTPVARTTPGSEGKRKASTSTKGTRKKKCRDQEVGGGSGYTPIDDEESI